MSELIFDKWRKHGNGLSFEEYRDQCPHWNAVLTIVHPEEPQPVDHLAGVFDLVGRIGRQIARSSLPFPKAGRVVGDCPECGAHIHGLFGEWIEWRRHQCKLEGWKHCVLYGGLKEQLTKELGRPYDCDCTACSDRNWS